MVNVPQLLSLDLGKLHSVADGWRWIAWRLEQVADEVNGTVTQPIKTRKRWSGDDAKAAAGKLDGVYKDVHAVAKEAKAVGKFLDDVTTGSGDGFGSLKGHQERARQLVSDAAAHGLRVEGDGTVTWTSMRPPGPLSPAAQQQLKQLQARANAIGGELKKILAAVNGIDESLSYGLKGIFGTRDTFRTEDRNRHIDGRGLETSWTETKLSAVIAGLRMKGWGDAADLLKHYIDGSGRPYKVDADRMLAEIPEFKKDLDATLSEAKKGPDGTFRTQWSSTSAKHDDGDKSMNWYYGLHHFEYRVVGEKHGGEVSYYFEVKKRYDWGIPSEHRRPLDGGPISFEQPEIARLNLVGEGKDFDVLGRTSTKTIR